MAQPITGSKSRPQARKRLLDDAAFTVSGGKRMGATVGVVMDKMGGTPEPRVKRKRVDTAFTVPSSNPKRIQRSADDLFLTLTDFMSLSTDTLRRYLLKYDIIPPIYPDPLSTANPPLPAALLNPVPPRPTTPPPLTPANRPQRRQSLTDAGTRRRSSRLLEEEEREKRVPVASDVDELHGVLAEIAHRHWMKLAVRETDVVGSFLYAVRANKGELTVF